MNVRPIGFAQQRNNSQPTFNGLTQINMESVVKEANEAHKKVDIQKLQDIKIMGTAVLKKFNHFMENLHKKTVLALDDTGNNLVVKNETMGTEVGFIDFYSIRNNTGRIDSAYNRIDAFSPSLDGLYAWHLDELNNLADTLVKASHKEEIDGYLFELYTKKITEQANNTSFFAGLKTKRNGKKADKLAPEFNQPAGWLDKLLEIRNGAIQKKKDAKKLAKANAQKAKEILEK